MQALGTDKSNEAGEEMVDSAIARFFFLVRISELGTLRESRIEFSRGEEGDMVTVRIRS